MSARSYLFVPGDSQRKLEKSLDAGADALIICLEDSVGENNKDQARELTAEFIERHQSTCCSQLWVRINSFDSGLLMKDLAAVIPVSPHGVFLPKPSSAEDFFRLDNYLSILEVEHGLELGCTKILSVAESAIGSLNQSQFVRASKRLVGLTWGAEDMSTDIGASTNRDDSGVHFLVHQMNRAQCLIVAAAGSMQPIDGICADYQNSSALELECQQSRKEGFSGKIAIHPSQVAVINECFTPSESEVDYARRVVEAFECSDNGTVGLDGRMLDFPHLKQARKLLSVVSGG